MWAEFSERYKSSDDEYSAFECRIQDSHRRCETIGIDRSARRIHDVLDPEELKKTVDTHVGLIIYTKSAFAKAFQSLEDRRAMFILTDTRARIIALYSYPAILNAAEQIGVCLGASLGEGSVGTNAVSLVLHDFENAVIRGSQHYCGLFHSWYCVAVPILGADGRPIGCLDISTSDAGPMGEKLALMNILAKELGDYCRHHAVVDIAHTHTVDKPRANLEIKLTERQHEVLVLFSRGLSYKQIAQELQLRSIKTVQEHLDAVRGKLGSETRRDCIRVAIELGLLSS